VPTEAVRVTWTDKLNESSGLPFDPSKRNKYDRSAILGRTFELRDGFEEIFGEG